MALILCVLTKTRPGSSSPSNGPVDLLYKPSTDMSDLILPAARRFVPMLKYPLTLHNLTPPLLIIACNHRIRQVRCRSRPTPLLRKMPVAPLLSVYRYIQVFFPVILVRNLLRAVSRRHHCCKRNPRPPLKTMKSPSGSWKH